MVLRSQPTIKRPPTGQPNTGPPEVVREGPTRGELAANEHGVDPAVTGDSTTPSTAPAPVTMRPGASDRHPGAGEDLEALVNGDPGNDGGVDATADADDDVPRPTSGREAVEQQYAEGLVADEGTGTTDGYDQGMIANDKVVTGHNAAYRVEETADGEAGRATLPFDQGIGVEMNGLMMGGLSNDYVAPKPVATPEPVTTVGGDVVVTKYPDGSTKATNADNNTETLVRSDGSTETRNATTGQVIDTTPPLVETPKAGDQPSDDPSDPEVDALRDFGRSIGMERAPKGGQDALDGGDVDPADPAATSADTAPSEILDLKAQLLVDPVGPEDGAGLGRGEPVGDFGVRDDLTNPTPDDVDDGFGGGPEDDPFGDTAPVLDGPSATDPFDQSTDSSAFDFEPVDGDEFEIGQFDTSEVMHFDDLDG